MSCNWLKNDYFSMLLHSDKRAHGALEMLVDDLHSEKERTITTFMCHSGSEDFLWGLVRLLGSDQHRVAGNSAYIIGTLAESELGCHRILTLAKGHHDESKRILPNLTKMLTFNDSESVMNAAGTIGTLAENHDGRAWILSESCLLATINNITNLLNNENQWTASNAALVLARLTIAEEGCMNILGHHNSPTILSQLVLSLGVDEAGRGMNAAFAVGRLCDMDEGRIRLLSLPESELMISSLAKMLSCHDLGSSKNACFALSCLATNHEGHSRLLRNSHSNNIVQTLCDLLSTEDSETGWFAAMTLRTLASQPQGCLRLRKDSAVLPSLRAIETKSNVNPDLLEEVIITLEILKRLEKPPPPAVKLEGENSVDVRWNEVTPRSGLRVRYQIYNGGKCIYSGTDTQYRVCNLLPCVTYSFKLRVFTEADESPFSDVVEIMTEESVPGPPTELRILGSTITQLKIGWDPPDNPNGVLRDYYIYQGGSLSDHTSNLTCIISGLIASSTYEIQVCASTSKGKGARAEIMGSTSELGAHAPSKPNVTMLGRNEAHITWDSPEVPIGRITRYDLMMNGKTVYSGTDLSYACYRLVPDTDYTFVVCALTSEGKFESKASKKRTPKDEFDASRAPLYVAPPKKEPTQDEILKANPSVKKPKPIKEVVEPKPLRRPSSAGSKGKKSTIRPFSKSSRKTLNMDKRPSISFHENSSAKNSKVERAETFVRSVVPLTVSCVDIEGDIENLGDLCYRGSRYADMGAVLQKSVERSRTFVDSVDGGSGANLKLDRSKTMLHGGKPASRLEHKLQMKNEYNNRSSHRNSSHKNRHISDHVRHAKFIQDNIAVEDDNRYEEDAEYDSWKTHIQRIAELQNLSNVTRLYPATPEQTIYDLSPESPPRMGFRSVGRQSFSRLPTTKYSVDKLQLGSSMTFHPNIPESKESKTHNKFVPMQMRTQPSNLPPGQLQRMSTSLLEPRGLHQRRLESLSRSQTQVDMKKPGLLDRPSPLSTPSPSQTKGRASSPFFHGSLLQSTPVNEKSLHHKVKSLKSPHFASKRTVSHKEPDSLLLQQEPDSLMLQHTWSMGQTPTADQLKQHQWSIGQAQTTDQLQGAR